MSELLVNLDDSNTDERDTIETNSDHDDSSEPQLYDEPCSSIVKKILKLNGELYQFHSNKAIFVPISKFEEFKIKIATLSTSIRDEHIWDFELQIGETIEQMKLIWIIGQKPESLIPFHENIKYAFNFLQPNYLHYMDKPFCNPDVFTQVNLILDYHRAQKRIRGKEIFNLCDLIKFKMAIDDNRYEYENCEFHKLINRTLDEIIQSEVYMKGDKFDLNEYLGHNYIFHNVPEIFEYLIYHFQKTIGSLYWNAYAQYPVKLSNITNIPDFLENIHVKGTVLVRETDSSGKCSDVLYEILTKSKNFIDLKFVLDDEWIYKGDSTLNEIIQPLARCEITIDTKNSFNFIENFINWLKMAFGTSLKYFLELRLNMFETLNPYILNNLRVKEIEFRHVKLNYKFIKMLTTSKQDSIYFINCRIENDINERYEFITRRSEGNQNIFKFFDDLHNVGFIKLDLEEHTIGTLFAYVASTMTKNKLTEFQCKNQMWIPNEYKLLFKRFRVNSELDQIEAYSRRTGDKINFYELLNRLNLEPSERDEFDFYQ